MNQKRALIPVACPNCGALFASRALSFMGNIEGLHLSGNRENCPYCGAMAQIADGVFNVADSVLEVVRAPEVTKEMLSALEAAVAKAHKNKTNPEQLASELEKINPNFAAVVRALGTNNKTYIAGLALLYAAAQSCSVNVTVDANKLFEQIMDKPPAAVIAKRPTEGK